MGQPPRPFLFRDPCRNAVALELAAEGIGRVVSPGDPDARAWLRPKGERSWWAVARWQVPYRFVLCLYNSADWPQGPPRYPVGHGTGQPPLGVRTPDVLLGVVRAYTRREAEQQGRRLLRPVAAQVDPAEAAKKDAQDRARRQEPDPSPGWWHRPRGTTRPTPVPPKPAVVWCACGQPGEKFMQSQWWCPRCHEQLVNGTLPLGKPSAV